MEQLSLQQLIEIFSQPRIAPYLKEDNKPTTVLNKYHANIVISEAMIPTLHYLEVCPRNRLNIILQKYFSLNWLKDLPPELKFSDQDRRKIEEITSKFLRERKRKPSHDDILSQMTFGFWCSFFHRKYDPVIWHRKGSMKILFPHLPRSNRKRERLN